jgi:hypothetical protein
MVLDWNTSCADTLSRARTRCRLPDNGVYYADTDIVMGKGRR